MNTQQIENIEQIITGQMIENERGDEKVLYTFQDLNNNVIFIEQYKRRRKNEPTYYVCTNSIDCWDGYDDARHVINHIKKWKTGDKI